MNKVLIVDDDARLREEYSFSLKKAGFDVFEISDGFMMESVLKSADFSVVLCDTDMPVLSGPEACRSAQGKGLLERKIVIGMSDNPDNWKYWKGIACDFFYKNEVEDIGKEILRYAPSH